MRNELWRKALIAGSVSAMLLATPGLPLPGADRIGLGGAAAAQGYADVGYFYDALDPFGQWVWHPRFGYVWLPQTVSPYWRPYTVGRWIYTDAYGWYWDSYEPFAWAVYHYGRWGYDPGYGWFWVPGDVWAPAWVQWRYSDAYVGWAPIGPGRFGYAYGAPVNYEPSIAEAWVFVQPRYLTSRAISHYALPIGALGPAFFSATTIYRPQYRGGIVYNYGMPRDRIVRITKRPVIVEKVYKVDRNGWDRRGYGPGVKIYAPGIGKGHPDRTPRRYVDRPDQFRAKAKLQETYRGDVPKGWGPSAKSVVPIAREAGPDAWKKKFGNAGRDWPGPDRDKDRDKGQPPSNEAKQQFDPNDWKNKPKGWDGDRGPNQARQDGPQGDPNGWNNQRKWDQPGAPDQARQFDQDGWKGQRKNWDQPGGPNQAKQFDQNRDDQRKGWDGQGNPDQTRNFDQGDRGNPQKPKQDWQSFGAPGGPGGPGGPGPDGPGPGGPQAKGGNQGDQGGGGGGDDRNKKKQAKCERNPEHPGCQ